MKKISFLLLLVFFLVGCEGSTQSSKMSVFREDLLAVEQGSTWGYINSKGEVKIPFQFDRAGAFYNEIAIIYDDNKANLINKKGELLLDETYQMLYRDNETNLIIAKSNDLFGLIDQTGKIILDPIYDDLYPFSQGLAVVKENDKYGYIDTKGVVMIGINYDDAISFSQDLAPVKQNNLWGYINKTNELVIPLGYDFAYPFDSYGNAVVMVDNGTQFVRHLINKDNEVLISDALQIFGNGPIYGANFQNESKIYKSNGELLSEAIYTNITEIEGFYANILVGSINYQALFDEAGTEVFHIEKSEPLQRYILNYDEQFIMTNQSGSTLKLYYNNTEYTIEADALLQVLPNDRYIVQRGLKVGIMNDQNEVLLDFEYDFIRQGLDGYAYFRQNGLYGILNDKYQEVIPATYTSVWPWKNFSNHHQQPHQ